jgi:FtsP/CotA-like multicopper oxidase with cupredoxin domain
MSGRQRFTFLGIAAAIAVLAVVLLAGGGAETGGPKATTPTATPTREPSEASPAESPTPTATPQPPLLSADEEKALTVTQGETVRFLVRSTTDEEVHVHGYDLKKDVRAGQTISFAFKADIAGIFEIEFEKSGTTLAQLKVVP